jgi:excisionase family DNA binding protein
MNSVEETVSAQQAADLLGVNIRTVRDWIKKGELISIKGEGNSRRIPKSAISKLKTGERPQSNRLQNLHDRYIHGFKVPTGFDLIDDYEELSEYTHAFAQGSLPFLLLVGSPGSGKSRQMRAGLHGASHRWIDNHATNLGLYCSVYEASNSPIVLDDINHFLNNTMSCSLMKALTQTDKSRSVSWESTARILEERDVPRQFFTTSPICMIANKWDGNDPDMAAIQDRSTPVAFYPDAETIHKRVDALGWCDAEVWQFVGKHLPIIRQPSMREYYLGMTYRKAGMKWQEKLLNLWKS